MAESATEGGPAPAASRLLTPLAFYRSLPAARKRRLFLVLAVMLLGAFAELLTIGAVLPFLALIADPASAASVPGFGLFLALVGADEGADLVIRATILLAAAAILAAAVRMLMLRVTQNFAFAIGHEIATAIFTRMLRQPYSVFVQWNPSEAFAGIEKVQILLHAVLLPLMQGIVAAVIALCIVGLLVVIAPAAAGLTAAALMLIYLAMSLATSGRLRANAAIVAQLSTARMKAVQEALGDFRTIVLEHSQPLFEERFRRIDLAFRQAQVSNAFVGAAPRYVVEAAGIVLLGLLALHMSTGPGGLLAAVPLLGAFALSAQRLLPLLQAAYLGWSQLRGNNRILRELLDLTTAPVVEIEPVREPVRFAEDIVLDRVGLQYPSRKYALRDVSLTISKGERIGLVGRTGSGKSSLLDLVMGLLEPSGGQIRIDGRPLDQGSRPNWQAQIAHVPQSIYLADASIASNIAFGHADAGIDMERVREAARQAQLDSFIESLPEGYETQVGDRGIRLSGGQRQRIALARAFHRRANVLILDEATGQLDPATEDAVMEAVATIGREITILISTHRISAVAGCDRIVRLEAGRLVEIVAQAGVRTEG